MKNTNKFLERKKKLREAILKIENKKDLESIKVDQDDEKILFELFSEFLAKNNFERAANLLFIIASKFHFGLLSSIFESVDSKRNIKRKEIEERLNVIFARHIEKLIKENDYASFKKLFEFDKFWKEIEVGKTLHQSKLSINSLEKIPSILEKHKKYNWVKILVKRAYPDQNLILKFIKNSIKNYPSDILKYCGKIYLDSFKEKMPYYYYDEYSIDKHINTLIELELFFLIDEILFDQDFEIDLPEILLVLGKRAYDYLSDKIDDYFVKKREFNKFSLYALFETLKKNDLEKARKIIDNLIVKLKDFDDDKKDEYLSILLIYYGLDRKNCSKKIINIFKLNDINCLKYDNNIYYDIDEYFHNKKETIFKNLILFIRNEKLSEEDKNESETLLIYSDIIRKCIERDIKASIYLPYFGILLIKLYKLDISRDPQKKANEAVNKFSQEVGVAETLLANSGYVGLDSSKPNKELKIILRVSFVFLLASIKEKKNFFDLFILLRMIVYLINELYGVKKDIEIKGELSLSNKSSLELILLLKEYNQIIVENSKEFTIYDNIISNLIFSMIRNLNIKIALENENKIAEARIEERNKIIADLSHSIKNMLGTVIDPLENLKQENGVSSKVIDNAIRGANLIRQIVNAMNLSFKGSYKDFIYDAKHNKGKDAISIQRIIIESLKHSISNMFDSKYFGNFMRNYFPNKKSYYEAKSQWKNISDSTDVEVITKYINKYFFKTKFDINLSNDFVIGNEKGSVIKLQILFQEIIFNAVKYTGFVNRKNRLLKIKFSHSNDKISFEVENSYKPSEKTKTTGLGHVVIENFAKLLRTEPTIGKSKNRFSLLIKYDNFWSNRNDLSKAFEGNGEKLL